MLYYNINKMLIEKLKCLKKASLSKESRDPQEVFDPVTMFANGDWIGLRLVPVRRRIKIISLSKTNPGVHE